MPFCPFFRKSCTAKPLEVLLFVGLLACPAYAATYQESILYSFNGGHGSGFPRDSNLTEDLAGNFYGTTFDGGQFGNGTIFRINGAGQYLPIHEFTGGPDGGQPEAGVILDSDEMLYGITTAGGAYNLGVVFSLSTAGTYTVLHSFNDDANGCSPMTSLYRDSAGNLYGTTPPFTVCGVAVIYKIDPSGNETVLHTFTGDDSFLSGVVGDAAGNLYGTIYAGGKYDAGQIFVCSKTG